MSSVTATATPLEDLRTSPRAAARRTPLGVLAGLGRVAGWLLGVAGILLVVACVLVPRVAGAEPFTVLTGSMRPGIAPGDLVVVRPVSDPATVGVGTVITYQLHSGQPQTVTHRVVAVSYDGSGRPWFTTQGDANPAADPDPVRVEQVRGSLWYSVPQAGRIALVLDEHRRDALRFGAGALLLGYAGLLTLRSRPSRSGGRSRGKRIAR